ncbi:EthD domain-containing protein [Tomitella gaofuii]|uniref:EthD domain-containing protein n=1 Tax=Tomitella gaofuii TaxID=2760083 RepID=UPI0015F7A409|nr:EthD domain-containing protein [Tomitella gaofuii]
MEKVIYALWRGDEADERDVPARDAFSAGLRGPVAGRIAAAGARGVQVCADDGAVADAPLRLTTFERPVAAFVAVWLDRCQGPERRRIEEILQSHAGRIEGWLVTESVPVAMPTPEGTGPDARVRGFTGVALLRRPDGMNPEYWRSRWQDHHTQVAIDVQGTFGYVQNLVVRAVTDGAPALAAIVEEQFPDAAKTDIYAFYGVDRERDDAKAELTRRTEAMSASTATFGAAEKIDVVPASRYVPVPPAFGSALG